MNKSNLKPTKKVLDTNLDQYRQFGGAGLSDVEFQVLSEVCMAADKAIRAVTRIALEHVPNKLKCNLFPSLTAGHAPVPMATEVGDGAAYRISIPISFIASLVAAAPKVSIVSPHGTSSCYFTQSVVIAILAAYAHELIHIFAGHINTQGSIAQETHADYMGGALTWGWLRRDDIRKLCGVPGVAQSEHACVFGFLHLVSVLEDGQEGEGSYLPRPLRLYCFSGGAAFLADESVGIQQGDLIKRAMSVLPACPDSTYLCPQIEAAHKLLISQMSEAMVGQMEEVNKLIGKEKQSWYDASQHLRPIKKALGKSMKRHSRG